MLQHFIIILAAASTAAAGTVREEYPLLDHFRAYQDLLRHGLMLNTATFTPPALVLIHQLDFQPNASRANADQNAISVGLSSPGSQVFHSPTNATPKQIPQTEPESFPKLGSTQLEPLESDSTNTSDNNVEEPWSWAARHQMTIVGAAIGVPLALLGVAGMVSFAQRNRSDRGPESLDSAFGLRHSHEDDDDESSVGGFTEDGFQSKFEVGNDAAMWERQADFSAF